MNALQAFDYHDEPVRTVVHEDESVWFVAQDVCRVLNLGNTHDSVARLDEDERDGVDTIDSIGRKQVTTVISESGLYALVFTSRKEKARDFRKWVTSEVLPALRRNGHFAPDGPDAALLPAEYEDTRLWISIVDNARRVFGRVAAQWLWRQSPLPQPPGHLTPPLVSNEAGAIGGFIADVVAACPGSMVPAAELYAAYRSWCGKNGASVLNQHNFGRRMSEQGFGKIKHGIMLYENIELRAGV